jgi:hypothetical protein
MTMMRARHQRAVVSGLLAVAVMAAVGCGDDDGDDSAISTIATTESTIQTTTGATSSPDLAPDSIPAGDGSIEPGTYRVPASVWSVADFMVTLPRDWTVQYGHVYSKYQASESDEMGFYAVVVDDIYADACAGSTSGTTDVGPSVDDLVEALLDQPGPMASEPVDTTLGGYAAVRIDLTVPQDFDLTACNLYQDGFLGLQVWYSQPADKYFVLSPDSTASVYILDVGGERQVVLTGTRSTSSDGDVAELQSILDSIRFEL